MGGPGLGGGQTRARNSADEVGSSPHLGKELDGLVRERGGPLRISGVSVYAGQAQQRLGPLVLPAEPFPETDRLLERGDCRGCIAAVRPHPSFSSGPECVIKVFPKDLGKLRELLQARFCFLGFAGVQV